MLAKIVLVIFLATITVSFAKNDDNVVNVALNSGSHIINHILNQDSDEQEKYIVDLNSYYKKYDIDSKLENVKSHFKTQFKKGLQHNSDLFNRVNIETEKSLKRSIDVIKKQDALLGEKLNKFYELTCQTNRVSEEIANYVSNPERIHGEIEKLNVLLRPYEQKVIDFIKSAEGSILKKLS
ncbi:Hypothetical protein CINCED_3A021011 [Cinara cedri]|uniref:Uncharacterized protein n=1 Tax=Cinara cedri TaxID=506608 RepID=A0A5E4MER0_9HEMI|nr:Hypothetical protein CINCED_3A021011 [Cinara cedri]